MLVFTGIFTSSMYKTDLHGGWWIIPVTIPYTEYFVEVRVKAASGVNWYDPRNITGGYWANSNNTYQVVVNDDQALLMGFSYMVIVVAK